MSKMPAKPFFNFPVYKIASTKAPTLPQNSNKNLTIICSTLNENSRDFLSKVMQAVNIDLVKDATLITNLAPNTTFSTLTKEMQSDTFILFDKTPEEMGLYIHCSPYQVISLCGKQLLFGDNLDTIQNTPLQKKALWKALQQLFPRVSDGS